jgi:hypothetical protein
MIKMASARNVKNCDIYKSTRILNTVGNCTGGSYAQSGYQNCNVLLLFSSYWLRRID